MWLSVESSGTKSDAHTPSATKKDLKSDATSPRRENTVSATMRLERPRARTRENARKRTYLSKKVTFKSIKKGEPSIRAPPIFTPPEPTKDYIHLYRTTTALRDAHASRIQSRVAIAKMPPRRNVQHANNSADCVATAAGRISYLSGQIKEALKNDAENVERNNGTNGEHNGGNEHRKGCLYKGFTTCKPKDFYGTEGAIGALR
ncbi:hypothetical protein L1987_80717 [Smallanthus sonchifolius]|uniref:Uncharacterized protein n=1 Tax=Smallanthus sonchifolius TaxID=185202 RepID=A0ACB8YP29_9ASTR|nr:hypothetical protein L1987_80717 [Smallanthus sonchifolius]